VRKPARAKAAPAKPAPKAAQPGNRPGRGKAAHAKKAPAHVSQKVKASRHAAAVKASKTRAANAKKAKAHPRRQLALGSAVACCSAEALAASLRLSGWPVSDADVLALYLRTTRDLDAGASILATLEAAAEYGLAGVRPVRFAAVELTEASGGNLGVHPGSSRAPASILGLALPAPHAVLDTGTEWMSWGQAWPVSAFPDVVIEEAWLVDWG
jgi:hypothetical protein